MYIAFTLRRYFKNGIESYVTITNTKYTRQMEYQGHAKLCCLSKDSTYPGNNYIISIHGETSSAGQSHAYSIPIYSSPRDTVSYFLFLLQGGRY